MTPFTRLSATTDGAFTPTELDTNDTYAYTFTKAGTIAYHCGLHPFMKGQIVVK